MRHLATLKVPPCNWIHSILAQVTNRHNQGHFKHSPWLTCLPVMSRYASAKIGGPLSMGFPEPLKIRPSMSWETGVFKTCEQVIIRRWIHAVWHRIHADYEDEIWHSKLAIGHRQSWLLLETFTWRASKKQARVTTEGHPASYRILFSLKSLNIDMEINTAGRSEGPFWNQSTHIARELNRCVFVVNSRRSFKNLARQATKMSAHAAIDHWQPVSSRVHTYRLLPLNKIHRKVTATQMHIRLIRTQ